MNLADQTEPGVPATPTAIDAPSGETTSSPIEQRADATLPASDAAASDATSSTEARERARIRIGSQREKFQPRVTPKPGFDPDLVRAVTAPSAETPPASPPPAPEPPATSAATLGDRPMPITSGIDEAGAIESGSALQTATVPMSAATEAPVVDEPSGRGKRRERRQRTVVPDERVVHTVDLPNLRRGLTPEQEAEFDAALAGVELESLLSAPASTSRAGELAPDTRLTGRIVSMHRDSIFVDVGRQHQGIVSLRQFAEPPIVGSDLEVVVTRFDADEGLYTLSVPGGAVSVGDWSQVSEGLVVEARITGHNKGGLECEVGQLRGFIPASQVALYRVEDFSQFVGEKWECVVTEAKPEKRNLVLSRRAYLEREQESARAQLLTELAPGQVREGVVRSLQPFGAFVDLGGVDGLLHVSQISWARVNHPNEVLQVGQRLQVRVLKIDPNTHKIALGCKDLQDNPWTQATSKFPVRSTVHGHVTKLMDFGAFVEIEPGVEGLVHISELDHKRVFRVSDVLTVGQEVDAQILSVDVEKHRISLSIKALKAMAAPLKVQEPETELPTETPAQRAAREKALAKLKGGRGKSSGGEQFGLKW
ncbi:MAG: S1 RNA-binding domain-containing protein [Pirellulales bacterium]|nr:S1 RNA-binding domain-containing protein [Pirellulales bacterium]